MFFSIISELFSWRVVMSEKRKDDRNRILHSGESQHQDGRYAHKYKDLNGEAKFVYSWRLGKKDRTPAGWARDLSLREKEKLIQQDFRRSHPMYAGTPSVPTWRAAA